MYYTIIQYIVDYRQVAVAVCNVCHPYRWDEINRKNPKPHSEGIWWLCYSVWAMCWRGLAMVCVLRGKASVLSDHLCAMKQLYPDGRCFSLNVPIWPLHPQMLTSWWHHRGQRFIKVIKPHCLQGVWTIHYIFCWTNQNRETDIALLEASSYGSITHLVNSPQSLSCL